MIYKKTPVEKIVAIIIYIILLLTSLTCILPFVNLLAVSLSSKAAVAAGDVAFFPIGFNVEAYRFAVSGGNFLRAFWVSVRRVVLGVGLNMILVILTAYPLSRSKEQFSFRNIYMIYFVITMIVGGGLIPTYLLVTKLGILNSLWALVLPGALPISNMIIMMNFIRGLPFELEESAMIDGAGPITILLKILMPLLKPSIATISLFCIVGHWNDWFSGMIYMQNSAKYPLQTYLQTLLRSFEAIMRLAQGDWENLVAMLNVRSGRAAQLFLGALPIMLIYPVLQKHFTTGLVMGSVKG